MACRRLAHPESLQRLGGARGSSLGVFPQGQGLGLTVPPQEGSARRLDPGPPSNICGSAQASAWGLLGGA